MRSLVCVGRAIACALPALVACALVGCGSEPARPTAAAGSALAAGGTTRFATLSHTCALQDGGVQCWGAAHSGQTGDGSLARRRPLPVRVAGLPERVHLLAAGGAHSCAASDAQLWCWGQNAHAEAGRAPPFLRLAPAPVAGVSGAVTALAAGLTNTCAVVDARLRCWGRNEHGESGQTPQPGCREPHHVRRCSVGPTPVAGVAGTPEALALGDRHGCALADGAVFCWGGNDAGQRGDPEPDARAEARRVDGLPERVEAIAAGARRSCALAQGAVFCWGAAVDANATPQAARGVPQRVRLPAAAHALAAGGDQVCAALAAGVWCWRGDAGPRRVEGLGPDVSQLALGRDHACARAGAQVRCWGENDAGQLGDGSGPAPRARAEPVAAWDDGTLRDRDGDGQRVVVCLGDSNTQAIAGAPVPWCDRLPALLPAGFRVVNRGEGGATASARGALVEAADAVAYAIENDAPDLAILAYGTNDVLAGVPPKEIVAALARHVRRLLEHGVQVRVATIPPLASDHADGNREIAELDRLLAAAFGPDSLIDFHTGVDDAALLDGIHLGDAAQAWRAQQAAHAITRLRNGATRVHAAGGADEAGSAGGAEDGR